MKRILISTLILAIAISVKAQYPNAYEAGQGWAMYYQGVSALCDGEYEDAYNYFKKGTSYFSQNWEGLGVCYELGFYVDKDNDMAWECYRTGAKQGSIACKNAINRINNDGFYSKSQRNAFLRNLRASLQATIGGYGGNSNSSSSTNRTTCLSCYGKGICQVCGGTGKTSAWQNRCWTCHGTGKCAGCNGKGYY